MATREYYADLEAQIRRLLQALDDVLSVAQRAEVDQFLNHGEYGLSLSTLAWILVDDCLSVTSTDMKEIFRLATTMHVEEDLPPSLKGHARG